MIIDKFHSYSFGLLNEYCQWLLRLILVWLMVILDIIVHFTKKNLKDNLADEYIVTRFLISYHVPLWHHALNSLDLTIYLNSLEK